MQANIISGSYSIQHIEDGLKRGEEAVLQLVFNLINDTLENITQLFARLDTN